MQKVDDIDLISEFRTSIVMSLNSLLTTNIPSVFLEALTASNYLKSLRKDILAKV